MSKNAHFFRVGSAGQVGPIIAKRIAEQLKKGPVLWLVSGGSAAEAAVACAKLLNGRDLSALSVSLADERYGAPGHADSNWRLLADKGFSLSGASLQPYLTGKSFEATRAAMNQFFSAALGDSAYKIALLGMGDDGHTAGILPGSPAVSSKDMVAGYQAGGYQRLTLSLEALIQLDEVFLYTAGDAKAGQLDKLAGQTLNPAVQPAQIIKSAPRWAVYNDRIGEAI